MKKKVNTGRTPIYRDAGFNLEDAGTTRQAFQNEKDHPWEPSEYIYSSHVPNFPETSFSFSVSL